MSVTRKGQVPSRTPVPGPLPETKSKEAAGPQISGPGPVRDWESLSVRDQDGGGGDLCRMTSQGTAEGRGAWAVPL